MIWNFGNKGMKDMFYILHSIYMRYYSHDMYVQNKGWRAFVDVSMELN